MARMSGPITPEQLRVVPANEASWDDLEALLGLGGHAGPGSTPVIYRAHSSRKKDQDWNDSGLVLVDH